MDKIVSTGKKIDLHIHSCASHRKDGAKVKNNTISNIPVLIDKLNQQGVNICAITDHDCFSYAMYKALKEAEMKDNSIEKVLPGVEFSVFFTHEGNNRVIHIVAIFSDEEEERIANIESILDHNPPTHQQAYYEEEFLKILREIGINTILIAHQKNTLTSVKARQNDANILGEQKFLEFVYTDYFEGFEFKNRRNEIINKNYLFSKQLYDRVCFVTGTDCHDWNVYPAEDEKDRIYDFPYTYAKCLPTFKGLVMAITDHSRLKMVNSFFSTSNTTIHEIQFSCDGKETTIPMSRGINVIIGDNSIGKSLLLHALTGFEKEGISLENKVERGYKKYLKENKIKIGTTITKQEVFCFDMQGEVRRKFEENALNATEFLRGYFPAQVGSTPYKNILLSEINRMIEYLKRKFEIDSKLKRLTTFCIEVIEGNAESLSFVNNLRKSKTSTELYTNLISKIESIVVELKELSNMLKKFNADDRKEVLRMIDELQTMRKKYENLRGTIERENNRIEIVAGILHKKKERHEKSISEVQKKRSKFDDRTANLKTQISELIREEEKLEIYTPNINPTKTQVNSNRVYDYDFIEKLKIDEINNHYVEQLIKRVIKANKKIDWKRVTEAQLKSILLRYDDTSVLVFFKNALMEQIEEDLSPQSSIIVQGMDKYAEFSSGLDAKIYFDLLSYERLKDGVYIIDQPEDNISQSAIRDYLLDRFKTMAENRQVIMVTHNPQFIVNLDVDNLIYLSKDNTGLQVQSGALEYEDTEYDILDIVAQNVDGGLDSIRKRWKRYEKTAVI